MVKVNIDSHKSKYTMDDLLNIIKALRAPGGCPWDAEQTHKSIRNDMLEEAYEVADAIDCENSVMLCEELGDVLLQVVFHSQVAEDYKEFDFTDVVDGIAKKLILRHPHVFGDVTVNGTDEVLSNWDKIKMLEKSQTTFTDTLLSVPKAFPALMRAQKVQKRAQKAGLDFPDVNGPLAKLHEELREVEYSVNSNPEQIADEIGDLLFSAVNAARHLGVNSEEALCHAVDKFTSRFAKAEQMANSMDKSLDSLTEDELDVLWNKAKQN